MRPVSDSGWTCTWEGGRQHYFVAGRPLCRGAYKPWPKYPLYAEEGREPMADDCPRCRAELGRRAGGGRG